MGALIAMMVMYALQIHAIMLGLAHLPAHSRLLQLLLSVALTPLAPPMAVLIIAPRLEIILIIIAMAQVAVQAIQHPAHHHHQLVQREQNVAAEAVFRHLKLAMELMMIAMDQ